MLFNSLHFLGFFPVVIAVYFALPPKVRWVWILVASCYFYAAFIPAYLLILFVLILIDYFAGLFIEGAEGGKRKMYLVVSLVANCAMLGFFKYYNFIAANLTAAGLPTKALAIVLPIGLSFHTFQSMSYTIEVYRGAQKAERHLGIYAVYVLYWPQLVAGPIERPQNLLHQFHAVQKWDGKRAASGAELMILGFAKKVLVADTLAVTVNQVYGNPLAHSGLGLLIATYFFAFQIYYDFSGYSDIARGVSRIMGIELMVNFDRPYRSTSLAEFWRRWHISLSTWFRDYLFIPLGGSRVSKPRAALNLLIVFLVSGLWHGANWTFVIWGGLHGVVLAISHLVGVKKDPKDARWTPGRIAKLLFVFHVVVLAWVFFRAETVGKAFTILGHLHAANGAGSWAALPLSAPALGVAVGAIFAVEALETWVRRPQPAKKAKRSFVASGVRYAVAVGIVILVLFRLTDNRGPQQFIYFQF